MAEVDSHQDPIEALGEEGTELKTQGTPEDGKKVDHWVEDVVQRWEELSGAVEEKEVSSITCLCDCEDLRPAICVACA